jgi:hypothetical protein
MEYPMEFHTGRKPFVGQAPMAYSAENECDDLAIKVRLHNEAHAGRGLKFLRSFLSNVAAIPAFSAVKPIYAAVNSATPGDAVGEARVLLSQLYDNADEHFRMTQVACFVKKYPFSGDAAKRRENATRKFLRGERRNRHLNALLWRRRTAHGQDYYNLQGLGRDPRPCVAKMRQFIRRVIGDTPPMELMFREGHWGPGAVVGVNGAFTHFGRKLLAEEWTVTPAAVPYVLSAAKRLPMFWEALGLTRVQLDGSLIICVDPQEFDRRMKSRMVIVQHNKVAFVPKDADCDRTIASEPLLNQFLQLAVDWFMKLALRRAGVTDLTDQAPNQELARKGSILGWLNRYCTVDLKNASGSVYTELVRELFPSAWFKMLNDLRSPSWAVGKDDPIKYHGFVSMGNGYCFPLETLIFASICSAAHAYTGTAPDFRVYGDDIIVRQNESGVVQEYLRYFGFELNPDKSFFFGPFRESCGADWYDGEPVRPVYLDDALDSLEQRIRAHNAFARLPAYGEPLAHACRNWFPVWISKFARPFEGETDEAVDNRHATVPEPWHLRNKTLGVPAWYGLRFSPKGDRDIGQHPRFEVAYKYAVLQGASSEKPFAMRRETRMSVARFYHGGALAVKLPHERGLREQNLSLPYANRWNFIGPRGVNLKTPLLGRANRPT